MDSIVESSQKHKYCRGDIKDIFWKTNIFIVLEDFGFVVE
jgi:hypothetical protein